MPRIDEPRPPGVSRTSTYAAYPPSSARSTEFSTNSCVTGLMSLSRCAARTRGVSATGASFRARTPGTATSAATASREGKKSPQNGAWHRCKDSISGGSPLLPANGSRATLDFRAPTSRHLPRSACGLMCRPERVRLELGACDDGRPADWRTACGDDGCCAAVHACRGLVAWQRPSGVADTLDRRPLERLATCGA